MTTPISLSSPALQLTDGAAPLRVSSIGRTPELTLEAWIAPSSVDQQRAVLSLSGNHGAFSTGQMQLVLCAGGSHQELSLAFVSNKGAQVLMTVGGALKPGVFTHVAATIDRTAGGAYILSLYGQGQLLGTKTLGSKIFNQIMPAAESMQLSALLSTALLDVHLGGADGAIGRFVGSMAEARIWSAVLSASDIAGRSQARARGDEASLLACYHLDEIRSGCVFDAGPRRGFGSVDRHASIASAPAVPLASATSADHVTLAVSGKLLRESIVVKQPKSSLPVTVGITIPAGVAKPSPYATIDEHVFDATLQPKAPDGTSMPGSVLQVRVDGDVTVLIDDGDFPVYTAWKGGTTNLVTVTELGKVRLRFLARDLSFPTVRVWTEGMPSDLWAVVRPDEPALARMQSVDQQDLVKPADGRASPLPSGASGDDAAACARAMQSIGAAVAPPSSSKLSSILSHASSKSFLGDVGHAVSHTAGQAGDALGQAGDVITHPGDTLSQTGGTILHGLKTAGSAAGSLSGALVDDGNQAVQSATKLPRTASQLLASSESAYNDLIVAASQAPARMGHDAIVACIGGADSLAFVAENAGQIAHTLAIVGTSLINGATVCWRVVASGFNDAIAAAKAFFERVGADIMKILDYLAYLFNWGDFLEASDEIYAFAQDTMGQIDGIFGRLDPMKKQLEDGIASALDKALGDKSLADYCGMKTVPKIPSLDPLDYVLEQAQRLLGSAKLSFAGADATMESLLGAYGAVDLSSGASAGAGALQALPTDKLVDPIALLTTPLGQLATGATTSVIDFVFDTLVSAAKQGLTAAQKLVTARISVPGLTSMIEDTILGGRQLDLLRLISLGGGIAMVLEKKISASASGTGPTVSFSWRSDVSSSAAKWTNFGFGLGFAVVLIGKTIVERAMKAIDATAAGAAEKLKPLQVVGEILDLINALFTVCRAAISEGQALTQDGWRAALGIFSALADVVAAICVAGGAVGEYSIRNRAAPAPGKTKEQEQKELDRLMGGGLAAATVAGLGFSIALAAKGGIGSSADWAAFGFKCGSLVFYAGALSADKIGESLKAGKGSKGVDVTKGVCALGVVACDVGSALSQNASEGSTA